MLQRSPRAGGLIGPCLPSPAKAPPCGADWLHEIKHDGFRIMARRARVAENERVAISAEIKAAMARIGDVVLLEKPADDRSPKRIDCYQIAERSAGAAFRCVSLSTHTAPTRQTRRYLQIATLDPARLVYSLRWKHKAEPPDFELALAQYDPELWERWVNAASLTLLAALRRRAPEAIDWTAMGDVIPVLDAFEAHMEGKTARRH